MMTKAKAAEMLDVTRSRVTTLCQNGSLTTKTTGCGYELVTEASVQAYRGKRAAWAKARGVDDRPNP